MARKPLLSRPLDLVYFIFFATHIPITLFIDTLSLYPRHVIPKPLQDFTTWYLNFSGDPVMAGAFGLNGPPERWVWLQSFTILELVFLLPTFIISARALYKDAKKYYPHMLIYGVHASVTTLACFATILSTPIASEPIPLSPFSSKPISSGVGLEQSGVLTLTKTQRIALLQCYVPYMVMPLIICVDMAIRVSKGQREALRVEHAKLKNQ